MATEAATVETRGPQPVAQKPARRRPAPADTQSEPPLRYFLAPKDGDGATPSLGREVSNENEALIESLKSGASYFAVSEYRAVPDMTGKAPKIRKEAMRKTETRDK
ncbi:MAG TPA: hypothetical protein VMI06_17230 [Terriglobia bacterium]|nr:hypothetical protein [Terriglobia bacterium]